MDCQKILHRRNGPQGPDSGPDGVSVVNWEKEKRTVPCTAVPRA